MVNFVRLCLQNCLQWINDL